MDDGRSIIDFLYVEGQTLDDRLKIALQGRLPLDRDTLRIIRQIAGALDYAHQKGVIHRDVKPSNIILGSDGNAYLTDFGLAEVKPTIEAAKSMLSIEAPSGLSGTIPYMAPEQLTEGKPGDEHSDLYSLGVTVFRMLTGRFPYEGQGTVLIAQIIAKDPLSPAEVNPEIPSSIKKVLLQALDKAPGNRYASCSEFAGGLDEAAQTYLAFTDRYEDALKSFEAGRWRQAKNAFERLKESAPPGFKEIDTYLEQTRTRVESLEHFEHAQELVEQGAYQDALEVLEIIQRQDPGYDVADLYDRASEGQARVEKQELDKLYQHAVQQFQDEQFEACLNTWAAIRARDSQYPDLEEIEPRAREQAERQRELGALYDRGVDQMNDEEWDQATVTFRELQQSAPQYKAKEVGRHLAVATSMASLLSLLQEARDLLEERDFASCVDRLDELREKNDTVFMEAHGGNGVYTYYWDDERVGGPTGGSITFEVHGTSAIIGDYRVVSGDGQVLIDSFYVPGIDCSP